MPDEELKPDETPQAPETPEASEAPADVQLARALDVLKSWTYFERLREQRQVEQQVEGAQAALKP